MSQCVPSWELDENPTPPKLNLTPPPNFISDVPSLELDYEVAELTWENGQITMHGLGPPRTWEKPRASGTLESIVNQATLLPHQKTTLDGGFDLVPSYDHHHPTTATACATATVSMDALVPSSGNINGSDAGTCGVGCSTRVGSCSGMMARADQSVSGSATYSRQLTLDTFEVGLGVGGFTSTSLGSPGNTSSGMKPTISLTNDDHDSVCHSRHQREAGDEADKKKGKGKYSVSTKRSRAAAIHNQSERKRRDKINERMKTLQKLVPNSNKTDKASMLDEVIEYLKQMQAQIHMMSRMNMSPMMLPLALQQQLQMSMMAPMMNMGMGMGVMDINSMTRPNIHAIPPVLPPAAFMPLAPWEAPGDRLPTAMPDPLSTFLACQSQPMNMDTYTRMATLYQQLHQAPGPSSKN